MCFFCWINYTRPKYSMVCFLLWFICLLLSFFVSIAWGCLIVKLGSGCRIPTSPVKNQKNIFWVGTKCKGHLEPYSEKSFVLVRDAFSKCHKSCSMHVGHEITLTTMSASHENNMTSDQWIIEYCNNVACQLTNQLSHIWVFQQTLSPSVSFLNMWMECSILPKAANLIQSLRVPGRNWPKAAVFLFFKC